jgi:glycosyltransferase involved in cell wall biosynthesis
MSLLDDITPLILAYNEEPNLARVLEKLRWAKQVIVVDSFSTDATESICKDFPNVLFVQRKYDNASNQDNYGLTLVTSTWVLSMDSDYVLTDELINEMRNLAPTADGYYIPFKYCVYGRPLRATILPPRCALYRKEKAHYVQDGHTQRVKINGTTSQLNNHIHHDDRKPLSRWLWAQDRYTHAEANKLLSMTKGELGLNDKIRRMKIVAPWLVPIYCLVLRGGIFDGWAGFYYAWQRSLAETALAIRLIEMEKIEPMAKATGSKPA